VSIRCPYCRWELPVRVPAVEILDDIDLAEHLVLNHKLRTDSLTDCIRDRQQRYVIAPRRRARS
jgi:hypothetical protein